MTDCSDLEQALRNAGCALEDAKKRADELVGVLNAIQDAIFVLDDHGRITRLNWAADWLIRGQDIHQNSLLDSILSITQLNGDPVREEDKPWSRAIRGGTVIRERYQLKNPGQGQMVVLLSASPLIAGERLNGAVIVCRDISERHNLFLQISVEQARLRAMLENAPQPMVVVDRNSMVLMENTLARELVDWSFLSSSTAGEESLDFVWDAEDKPVKACHFPLVRSAVDGKTYRNEEVTIQTLKGEKRIFLAYTTPVRNPDKEIIGAVGIFQDISERKRKEARIVEQSKRMEMLAVLAQAFAEAGLDGHAVLDTVAIRTAEIMRDGCIIWLKGEGEGGLEPAASYHVEREKAARFKASFDTLTHPASDALSEQVMQNGEPVLLTDLLSTAWLDLFSPKIGDLLRANHTHSVMLAPLRSRGRILGMISLERDSTGPAYTHDDLAYLLEIVTLASLAIDNANLFRSLAREARERAALYAANEAILSTLDLEKLFGKILDAAQSAVPEADKGMLYMSLPETGELKLRSQVGFAEPRIARVFLTGRKDFVAQAAREMCPILVRDTWDHPSILARVNLGERKAPRSLIVAPMVLDQKVFGVLTLSASAPDAFTQADLDVLIRFATTAAVAYQNARLHTDVQRIAITDGLTGLYNRRGFFEIGRREFDRFRRYSTPLAAIMLDIDHFKAINDLYSHAVGDEVLRTLADRCCTAVRHVDILGRYGGDEFAILLPEAELKVAKGVAERLRKAASAHPVSTGDKSLSITISLGIVAARKKMKSLEAMLDRADAALYAAKKRGRNTAAVEEE